MSHDPGTSFDQQAVPAGALRILARRNDSEVLILHGEGRAPELDAGERLALVEWVPSVEIAEAMSRFCSHRLHAVFPPDRNGWHPYAVQHLKVLVENAKSELNVTYFPKIVEPRERQAWTRERIIRFVQLATEGHQAKAIAADPMLRTSENNVYQRAHEFGISLARRPHGQVSVRLPSDVLAFYDVEAGRVRLTRDALIARRLIKGARGAEPTALVG